jgi:adenosine deaminase CECR1
MEEYATVRAALEAKDAEIAHLPALSPEEMHVAEHLETLKTQFKEHFAASDMSNFYHIEGALRETELFKFLHKMPKGAHLHVHTTASVHRSFLHRQVLSNPKVYYSPSTRKLSVKHDEDNGYLPAAAYFNATPERMQELNNIISLNEHTGNGTSNEVWKHFMHLFLAQGNLVNNQDVFESFMRESFRTMREDNLQRVEYKHLTGMLFNDSGNVSVQEETKCLQRLTDELAENYSDFSVGYVYLGMKYETPEVVAQAAEESYQLSQQYPKVVLGFDLVGEEETLNPISTYVPALAELRGRSIAEGRPFKYFFHAGESINPRIDSIRHSLSLGTSRIGHGINLQHFPAEMDLVRERGVLVELCPISNMLLRYTLDLRTHPGASYLRRNLPVSINSDDPGMFGYQGVTHDFLYATVLWNLSLAELKRLILNSIEHCTEPKATLQIWERKWSEFVLSLGH